jgi:aspartyl protease family protein
MSALDPGAQARLFYLAILGMAFLTAGFAYYRGRLGAALQHAAIWGLIFAGLIIAYGFSDVLRRELGGAREATLIAEDAIALRRGADGHFHAPLEVNGRRIDALVDTGATAFVLSRRDAERAGIDTERLVYSRPAISANGVVYSAPVTLDRVALGPFEDRNVPAMVSGGETDFTLLGMRYLDRFRRLTVEGDRLVLER